MNNNSGTGFNSHDVNDEGNSGKRRTKSDGRSSKRSRADSLESQRPSDHQVIVRREFRSDQDACSSRKTRVFTPPPGLHRRQGMDRPSSIAKYGPGTAERIAEVQRESARHNLRLIDDPQKQQTRRSAELLWERFLRRDVGDPFNPTQGFAEEEIAIPNYRRNSEPSLKREIAPE